MRPDGAAEQATHGPLTRRWIVYLFIFAWWQVSPVPPERLSVCEEKRPPPVCVFSLLFWWSGQQGEADISLYQMPPAVALYPPHLIRCCVEWRAALISSCYYTLLRLCTIYCCFSNVYLYPCIKTSGHMVCRGLYQQSCRVGGESRVRQGLLHLSISGHWITE